MTTPIINKPVKNFQAAATSNTSFQLSDYTGKSNLVLYFYPKDNTPGCTTEGQHFRDAYPDFQAHDTEIFGISRDTMRKHENFKEKQSFPFELISDEDEAVCKLFDVIKRKKLYGKEYLGIERSTFLIDKKGILRQEWRKVKVKGHVDEVMEAVKSL